MEGWNILILVLAGAAAGFVNSIAGGGTILTFPTLILLGMNSIEANATSTVALIVGIGGSVYGYRRQIPAVQPWLAELAPCSVIGGLLGGVLLTVTPTHIFDRLVPFLILFATLLFMTQGFISRRLSAGGSLLAPVNGRMHGAVILFQFLIALYGGYFGAGIGILMLATLGWIGLNDIHQMNTVKTVLGGLINIVAAAYFAYKGLVDWGNMGLLALGAVPGYYAGSVFSQKIAPERVRQMITGTGLLMATYLFYQKFLR
jgi:uncharacterized membrane protein YfcA